MNAEMQEKMVEIGFSPTEAEVYLTLAQYSSAGAGAIAKSTGLSRTSIYQILRSLEDKGMVESGKGYGSKFTVRPPAEAFPALISRLQKRAVLAGELADFLTSLNDTADPSPEDLVQVIRSPRAVGKWFERFESEAKERIEMFSKPPYFAPPNKEQLLKTIRRGVIARSIYEKASIADPKFLPFLSEWLATGAEARVYDGELPHKLAIFDGKVAMMPVILPGEQMETVLIRNRQLAQSLANGFEYLWEKSKPYAPTSANAPVKPAQIKKTGKTGRS